MITDWQWRYRSKAPTVAAGWYRSDNRFVVKKIDNKYGVEKDGELLPDRWTAYEMAIKHVDESWPL